MSIDKHFTYSYDFEIKPESYRFITPDKYPSDIKRIVSIGDHTFHARFYFISEIFRTVYKLTSDPMKYQITGNSKKYCLVDDNNKRYGLYVNDRLFDRIKNMNKIILPKMK